MTGCRARSGSFVTPLLMVLGLLAPAAESAAQQRPLVRPARVEIGGGVGWVGQSHVGTRNATMTANSPGDAEPFTFFRVRGKTRSGLVGSGWAGVNLNRAFGVEGAFHYSEPNLSADISQDVEGTPNVTLVASTFKQYVVEGNLLYHVNAARFDGQHTVPYVLVGVGYLEQRDDLEGVKEKGTIYQGGVGFKWNAQIDRRRRAHGAGFRLDARYVFRDGGFDFEGKGRRSFMSVGATAFVAF